MGDRGRRHARSRRVRPGFVAYGTASILETADLPSPYPYLWSPADAHPRPHQGRLLATLAAPNAPTGAVQVSRLNSWRIDQYELLRGLLASCYHLVGTVCGRDSWLRTRQIRVLAPV